MSSPTEPARLVVGAAVVREGRVLAARRTRAPAGRWELPGGKVEPGESEEQALIREWHEEFGCTIAVERWLPPTVAIGDNLELRIAVATLVEGEPVPTEHDRVRWLNRQALTEVDWLDSDRAFLPLLASVVDPDEAGLRGIFFERDDADAVVGRLIAAGYRARVARELLAGEDDDEDHPWAVLTDAPEVTLDLLVEEFEGWLEFPVPAPATRVAVVPPPLPTAPRRIKRPPS